MKSNWTWQKYIAFDQGNKNQINVRGDIAYLYCNEQSTNTLSNLKFLYKGLKYFNEILKKKKQKRQQRHREWQRTSASIVENKGCLLEYTELTACLPSSPSINRKKLCGERRLPTTKFNNLCLPSRPDPFAYLCSRISCKAKTENYQIS